MKSTKVFTAKYEGLEMECKIINNQFLPFAMTKGYVFTCGEHVKKIRPQLLVFNLGKDRLKAKYMKALKTLKEEVENK